MTFLAALRVTGITAPLVVDGAINGALFLSYVQQQLAPTLSHGDMVVMDNLAVHKVAGVREAVEAAGAHIVCLPPHSPDMNPIELVFSRFKWLVRSAAERTADALWQLCRQILDQFTSTECHNYFRHCGYNATEMLESR
jgi:transposase